MPARKEKKRLTKGVLKKEVFRILRDKVTKIHIIAYEDWKPRYLGFGKYNDDGVEIWADIYHDSLDHIVIHEIIHSILDKHFDYFSIYNLSELWIRSSEEWIIKKLTIKETRELRRLIHEKLVKTVNL